MIPASPSPVLVAQIKTAVKEVLFVCACVRLCVRSRTRVRVRVWEGGREREKAREKGRSGWGGAKREERETPTETDIQTDPKTEKEDCTPDVDAPTAAGAVAINRISRRVTLPHMHVQMRKHTDTNLIVNPRRPDVLTDKLALAHPPHTHTSAHFSRETM